MAICNGTRGIDARCGAIRHPGVSDSSDVACPVWRSHSAETEMFFDDELPYLQVLFETGLGLDRKHSSVWFQTRLNTRPAASWRSIPGPVIVNPLVPPGCARPVGSNLKFCVSGFSIHGRIQISYSQSHIIDYGTAFSFSDVLTTFI